MKKKTWPLQQTPDRWHHTSFPSRNARYIMYKRLPGTNRIIIIPQSQSIYTERERESNKIRHPAKSCTQIIVNRHFVFHRIFVIKKSFASNKSSTHFTNIRNEKKEKKKLSVFLRHKIPTLLLPIHLCTRVISSMEWHYQRDLVQTIYPTERTGRPEKNFPIRRLPERHGHYGKIYCARNKKTVPMK